MPTLTVLMGPPGSGKTTWATANAPGQVLCLTDRLRTDRGLTEAGVVAYIAALWEGWDEIVHVEPGDTPRRWVQDDAPLIVRQVAGFARDERFPVMGAAMPKENVNCIAGTGLRAEVMWSPNNWVQVASINPASELKLDAPAGSDETEPELFYGWHATLDREGCNRMIRALRKARDAAYGADA